MASLDLPAAHYVDVEKDGVIAFRLPSLPFVRERWEYLREKSKSGQFRLHISLPFRPRTIGPRSQNNAIHGWESWICQVTGNDMDDLHLFLGRRAMRRGYPPKTNERGEIVYSRVDGESLPLSIALASVEQAQAFLEEIKQLAAEESIPLPEYEEDGRIVYR